MERNTQAYYGFAAIGAFAGMLVAGPLVVIVGTLAGGTVYAVITRRSN